MCSTDRRHFLYCLTGSGLLLTPLAATLSACSHKPDLPEGMDEIKWDRDICVRCNMVISDRRFGAELRGGPKKTAFKFDDIGCLLFWLRDKAGEHPWMAEPDTKMWVADVNSKGDDVKWLEPHQAFFITRTSPMGYNFGAVAEPQEGSVNFEIMQQHILAKGK